MRPPARGAARTEWIVQRRGEEEWVVVRLPSLGRIDPATLDSSRGAPAEVGDDPRPAILQNIPPYGPGF